ncbi:MAG: magnesium/cobalt transporter CorA [Luteibaculaceae bacterium]
MQRYLGSKERLNRKKVNPFHFTFTGAKNEEIQSIQLFTFNEGSCTEQTQVDCKEIPEFTNNESNFWLNIHGLDNVDNVTIICNQLDVHSLAIQDILDVNQRPKFQEFEGHYFLTLKTIAPHKNEFLMEQISFILGTNFLVSFQERKADYFNHVRDRLRENLGIVRRKQIDYLLYTLLESLLDNYFKTLDKLSADFDTTDFNSVTQKNLSQTIATIEKQKKLLLLIKKSILPIKEFVVGLERDKNTGLFRKNNHKYFLEIKDLCLTLLDNCEMMLSNLESSTQLLFYLQGHRMNQVMKTLTIVATIFIPLTFVAGVYGMNFNNMPELEWEYGYLGIWLVMLSISGGMIFYFFKKKWF